MKMRCSVCVCVEFCHKTLPCDFLESVASGAGKGFLYHTRNGSVWHILFTVSIGFLSTGSLLRNP